MNKVFLIGNLTRDPETRTTQGGTTVCSFTIAVNRRMKQDGQQETDYFNIVAWRQLGELCQKYLAKGRKCSVFGRIQTHSYEASDGSKRTAWDIVAEEVEFLSPVGQSAGHQGNAGGYMEAVSKTPDTPPDKGFTQVEDGDLPF